MKHTPRLKTENALCSGCKTCLTACRVNKQVGPDVTLRHVTEEERGGFQVSAEEPNAFWNDVTVSYRSDTCLQCEQPKCLAACASGAIIKREKDGIVFIAQELCVGCGACRSACPHGMISIDDAGKAHKCDLCMERLDRGLEPICMAACPLRLISYR